MFVQHCLFPLTEGERGCHALSPELQAVVTPVASLFIISIVAWLIPGLPQHFQLSSGSLTEVLFFCSSEVSQHLHLRV